MLTRIRASLLLFLLVAFANGPAARAQTSAARTTAPKTVTGSYRLRKDEARNRLDVQQLSDGRIKFYLLALWVSPYNPENIHNGELHGIVRLQNGTAVYEDENCSITMKFRRYDVVVTQADVGDCDFGANVTASGTYRKTDAKRPKFDF